MILGERDSTAIRVQAVTSLHGERVLHVADLVTEASSYVRSWLPAIHSRGGHLQWAINVVDRGQGGEQVLAQNGIGARHLIQIGPEFFERVAKAGYFNQTVARQREGRGGELDLHRSVLLARAPA